MVSLAEEPAHQNWPHSPLPGRVLLAIENAIRLIWNELRSVEGSLLTEQDEHTITMRLRDELAALRMAGSNAFSASEFAVPDVGANFSDYSGTQLKKMPDIVFRLKDSRVGVDSVNDGYFCECKIVGNGRSLSDYGNEGIQRFTDGRYAWAMPHALMLAYLRSRLVLPKDLADYLSPTGVLPGKHGAENLPEPCTLSRNAPPTFRTSHRRTYTLRNGKVPGSIELRHLWLDAQP